MNSENIVRDDLSKHDHESYSDEYRCTLPRLVIGKSEKRCLLTHRDGLLIYLPNINNHRRSSYPERVSFPSLKAKRPSLEPSQFERGRTYPESYNNNNNNRRRRKKKKRRRRRRKKKRKEVKVKRRVSQNLPPIQATLNPFSPPPFIENNTLKNKNKSPIQPPFRSLLKKRRRNVPRVKVTCRCKHGIDCLNRKRINEYSLIDSKRNIYINQCLNNQLFHLDCINKFRSPQRYDEIRYEVKILRNHVRILHPNIFSFIEVIDDFSDDNVYLVYPSSKIYFPSSEIFSQFSSSTSSSNNNNKSKNIKRQKNENHRNHHNNGERLMTLGKVFLSYQLDYQMIERWNKQIITLLNFLFHHRNIVISDITLDKDFLVDTEEGNILFVGVANLQVMDPSMFDEFDIRNCEVNMINIIGETLFFMCFGEKVKYDDYGKICFFDDDNNNNNNNQQQQQQQQQNQKQKEHNNNNRKKMIYDTIPEHLLELIRKTCNDEPTLGLESLKEMYTKSRSRERKREKRRKRREKKRILREEVCRLEEIIQRIDFVFRSRK